MEEKMGCRFWKWNLGITHVCIKTFVILFTMYQYVFDAEIFLEHLTNGKIYLMTTDMGKIDQLICAPLIHYTFLHHVLIRVY